MAYVLVLTLPATVLMAATGLYCAPGEDFAPWAEAGASFAVTGSDHSFLIQGARALAAGFAPHRQPTGDRP